KAAVSRSQLPAGVGATVASDPRVARVASPFLRARVRYHPRPAPADLPMSTIVESLSGAELADGPAFKAGDTVRVHFKVIEGNRQRVQVFEGICIKRQGSGVRETFTVRKSSFGVGVERTSPLHSPKIEKLEVAMIGDVNRAKLYYLRGRVGKRSRVRELRQSYVPIAPARPPCARDRLWRPRRCRMRGGGRHAALRARGRRVARGGRRRVRGRGSVHPESTPVARRGTGDVRHLRRSQDCGRL